MVEAGSRAKAFSNTSGPVSTIPHPTNSLCLRAFVVQ